MPLPDVFDPGGVDASFDPGAAETVDPGPPDLPAVDPGPPEGASDPGTADSPDAAPPGTLPWPELVLVGAIRMVESGTQGGIDVHLHDRPTWPTATLLDTLGPCRFYGSLPPVDCVPPCKSGYETCGPDGKCTPMPARVSAGTITFAGLKEPYVATPGDADWYTVTPSTSPDLFAPGATLTVKAAGAQMPAFEATVKGVADVNMPWASLVVVMDDDAPLVLEWTPAGDGSRVEVAFQIGWHGAPPTAILWCEADDSAGSIAVPAAFVKQFPPAGGMGLFQHPSYVQRVSRTLVDVGTGQVEVSASSAKNFSISHNPW
jgi:hypothetical protein